MAKGVKNLKLIEGKYITAKSDVRKRVTILPNIKAKVAVDQWHDATSDADKNKAIHWLLYDNSKNLVKKEMGFAMNITIPKKLCGSYYYYIEGSLSGSADFKSGIYVGGQSVPKILKSKWCEVNDGPDKRSKKFSFGNNVFLGLETEGINGNWLTVEIYRINSEITMNKVMNWISDSKYDPTKDDLRAKVFEKQALVIDGEINTDFTISPSWKHGNDGNEFYIKIRDGKKYIPDEAGSFIHARFLKVDKNIVPQPVKKEILVNNAPVKVGSTDKKHEVPHTCKFKVIQITDKGKTLEIFNEGKFNRLNSSGDFYTVDRIYYDYDKWAIRADAKPYLNKIARLLTEELKYIPVELGSHTDSRGTAEYNQDLSRKRAKSVVDYLISKGVHENRIHAKGYGESRLINHGDNISEELHQENRRTTIRFLVSENDAQSIVYDTLVGDSTKPEKIQLNISDYTHKGCYKKPTHTNKMKVLETDVVASPHDLKEGNNVIKHEVYSAKPTIPNLLNAFFLNSANNYKFFLHSCAYYSSEKTPALRINAYTDAKWTYNLRYDYTEPFFLHDIPVPLISGIQKLQELYKEVTSFLNKIGFLRDYEKDIYDCIVDFVAEETKKFSLGMHVLHNFSDAPIRKSPGTTVDYTEKYRKSAEAVILFLYVITIIIELLIIYVTRGKGSFGRIRKYRKYFKILDKLDDAGFEFIYPKLATNRGVYFDQKDGKISRVVEENVSAKPFLGIKYNKKHKLINLPKKEKGLQDLIDKHGSQATFTLDIEGTIQAEYNIKLNLHTREAKLVDNLYQNLSNSHGKFTGGIALKATASLEAKFDVTIDTSWVPFVRTEDVQVIGRMDAELGGYIVVSRQYAVDKGAYYQDTIFFSGIKGKAKQKLEVRTDGKKKFDSNPEDKTIDFILFDPQNIVMEKVYLFKL